MTALLPASGSAVSYNPSPLPSLMMKLSLLPTLQTVLRFNIFKATEVLAILTFLLNQSSHLYAVLSTSEK